MRKPWMRKLKTFRFTAYGDMTQETARGHKSADIAAEKEANARRMSCGVMQPSRREKQYREVMALQARAAKPGDD